MHVVWWSICCTTISVVNPVYRCTHKLAMTLLLNVSARVVSNCGTPPVLVVTVGNSSCIKYIPYYYIVESLVNRTLYYNVCDIFLDQKFIFKSFFFYILMSENSFEYQQFQSWIKITFIFKMIFGY